MLIHTYDEKSSSIGSFGVKGDWLTVEFKGSLCSAKNQSDCTNPEMKLVFPTVENVRDRYINILFLSYFRHYIITITIHIFLLVSMAELLVDPYHFRINIIPYKGATCIKFFVNGKVWKLE